MSQVRRTSRKLNSGGVEKAAKRETNTTSKRALSTKDASGVNASQDSDRLAGTAKKARTDEGETEIRQNIDVSGSRNVKNRRAALKTSPVKSKPKARATEEKKNFESASADHDSTTAHQSKEQPTNKEPEEDDSASENNDQEETFTVEIVPNLPDKNKDFETNEQNSDEHDDDDTGGDDDDDDDGCEKMLRADYDVNELVDTALAAVSNSKEEGEDGQKRSYKREFNIPCAYCEVMLKDYGYLFRHVSRLHKNEPDVNDYLDEIRPRMRAPCPICNKTVSCISNVSAHIKQCHADEQCAVTCPLCKKSYKTPMSLKQHIKQCHQPQVRKHKCSYCDMSFSESRGLKEHINCTHETTQIFRCDECGKTFLTKGRLRRHKYIHSEYRHYCQYCNKGFHLKDNMNKHIEIMHEKKQGKRFQCPHCEKNFAVKGNMKQHIMGVHLRQYPYSCPICGEGYRRKKDMLLHMEQHKEGMSSLKIEDVNIDPHSIKLPPPSVKVQMAPSDGSTMGTTVIEVLPQKIKVHTE